MRLVVGSLLAAAVLMPQPASADTLWEESYEFWTVYAWAEGKAFSHCGIETTFNDDTSISLYIHPTHIGVGADDPNWNLPEGNTYTVLISVGGMPAKSGWSERLDGSVFNSTVIANVPWSLGLWEALGQGETMSVEVVGYPAWDMSLDGMVDSLFVANECWHEESAPGATLPPFGAGGAGASAPVPPAAAPASKTLR